MVENNSVSTADKRAINLSDTISGGRSLGLVT